MGTNILGMGTGLLDSASSILSGDFFIYILLAGGVVLLIFIFKK